MVRGAVIDPDGTVTVRNFDGARVWHELKDLFGEEELLDTFSYEGGIGYVDDEGFRKKLDANPIATALYWGARLEGTAVILDIGSGLTPIVGRAVIFGRPDYSGDETDVGDAVLTLIEKMSEETS